MLEPPRVGLPNLVGQGDLVARARGAATGGEQAARATVAASLQQEGVQRAEHLPATPRVEAVGKDPHGQDGRGGHPGGHHPDDDLDPDDPEDGHLVDVTA